MILLITLDKLFVYRSKNYPELFYYYAFALINGQPLKIQGLATPELIKALVEHLQKSCPFECTVEYYNETLKLVQLMDSAYKSKNEELWIPQKPIREGEVFEFLPKQIVLRKRAMGIFAVIQSEDGIKKTGTVNANWIYWYLNAMRRNRSIKLLINETDFQETDFDPENQMGPNQAGYGESAEFTQRTITTYLDNSANFYFAI